MTETKKENNNEKECVKFYWAVCDDCGTEYSYGFSSCPKCFLTGRRSRGYKVKTSVVEPSKNVIRWNMESFKPTGGEKICANCDHRDGGFCWKFGDPRKSCSREEWDNCLCKDCCIKHKKFNERLLDRD